MPDQESADAIRPTSGAVDPKDAQQDHWTRTFATRTDFLGGDPSEIADRALARFRGAGARDLLELGAGQGRDTLLFVTAGLDVTAVDYAAPGLGQIASKAAASKPDSRPDHRAGRCPATLPFDDEAFDAVYAHMLLCMALSTPELESLAAEIRRSCARTDPRLHGPQHDRRAFRRRRRPRRRHVRDGRLHRPLLRPRAHRTAGPRLSAGGGRRGRGGQLPRRLFVVAQARS